MDAGAPVGCDRSWAHWNASQPSVFHDNGDGTVTDMTTRLLWQKDSSPTPLTQPLAMSYCQTLHLAGHCDWRLPTRIELGTLVDYTKPKALGPLIDTTVFNVSVMPNAYWTSSLVAGTSGANAWYANFNDGGIYSDAQVGTPLPARCVR
jgi:hypothetical protein